MEATSPPDMKRKRRQINGFGNVPLYVLLFILPLEKKNLRWLVGENYT